MSLTSYRAAPSRGTSEPVMFGIVVLDALGIGSVLGRPGSDLLSRVLRRSTIGAESFHGRVRDGIGCGPLAKTTRPSKRRSPDDGSLLFFCSVVKQRAAGLSLRMAARIKPIERL